MEGAGSCPPGAAYADPYQAGSIPAHRPMGTWGYLGVHEMLTVTLTPNRDTRPQFVTLVQHVLCYDDVEGVHYVLPVRRTLEWLRHDDGHDYLTCTRVTELKWKELRPTQAHRELVEQWMGHVRDQVKKGARPIAVQVVL